MHEMRNGKKILMSKKDESAIKSKRLAGKGLLNKLFVRDKLLELSQSLEDLTVSYLGSTFRASEKAFTLMDQKARRLELDTDTVQWKDISWDDVELTKLQLITLWELSIDAHEAEIHGAIIKRKKPL